MRSWTRRIESVARISLRRACPQQKPRETPNVSEPQLHPPAWELSDEKLPSQCRLESYVGPGPGGQKRHKTNAAVRVTHLPTAIHAAATDSRSHRENQIHAIRELRHKLAMELRREVDTVNYVPPAWMAQYPGLHINMK